jgi:SAM-dependent methyltransferase
MPETHLPDLQPGVRWHKYENGQSEVWMMTEEPMAGPPGQLFQSGELYEAYVGRWSRKAAPMFLGWLQQSGGLDWLDVGCGSGVLSEAILANCDPATVTGVDPSGMIAAAKARITDPRAQFLSGDARAIPLPDASVDVVVSGLVINFVPGADQPQALDEMVRVTRPGGTIAAYVWDYAGGMQMMRHFWDAAIALNPEAIAMDEATRSPICNPEPLTALFTSAGLVAVQLTQIDVPTVFRDFGDYWQPFVTAQAPAPVYLQSLPSDQQEALRDDVRRRLPIAPDGTISLIAGAWAVQGVKH